MDFHYTIAGANTGVSLSTTAGSSPKPPPEGLFATRAVQTKAGWIGQVLVDGDIIWETDPQRSCYSGDQDAQRAANRYVVDRFKALLAPPETMGPVIDQPSDKDGE